MKNLKKISVLGLTGVALAGCWDQDVENGSGEAIGVYVPLTSSISANFVKGPVTGASCELFEVDEAGAQSTSIGTGTTTEGMVDFGDDIEYFGIALVQCFGGVYTDEASGTSMAAPEMRAVVEIERDTAFSVTPLTEIATQHAEAAGDMNTAISTHNAAVGDVFGFSGDITEILPTDLVNAAASNNYEGQYAMILALLSQLHNNSGGSLSDLIDDLSEDLTDGEVSSGALDSMSQALVDLEASEVAGNLDDDAMAVVVDGAGISTGDDDMSGIGLIEETDDIGWPGNDIESVEMEIVDANLVIKQTHKGPKDAWHTTRVYVNTDDTDTMTTPMASGAPSLTGLVAEYGYIFERNDLPGWNVYKRDASSGAWVDAVSTASVTGGDTDVTIMTIPLSEIGNPADLSAVQLMFVASATGWATDQAPNDGMYQYVDPNAPEIVESDDIGLAGNDIESVSIVNDGANLVVTQTHKGPKDAWHTTRVYVNTEDSDTMTMPMASGAVSLTGLVAEYGYIFERNDLPGWNVYKRDASGGAWVDTVSTASVSGGDTDVTIMTIPLSEVGNPAVGDSVQMMFVGTATGWATDQAPNDAMLEYIVEAP